jgi:TnpA family transposase
VGSSQHLPDNHTQLNKGESVHALREFLFFAHRGKIRRNQEEEQAHLPA